LLKARRQELHAKIARVIEQRFPELKDSEPEVLAHHYTQAGELRTAIPLWQRAGVLDRAPRYGPQGRLSPAVAFQLAAHNSDSAWRSCCYVWGV
jgi:hypothetical protein